MPWFSLEHQGYVAWLAVFGLCFLAITLGLAGVVRKGLWRPAGMPALGALILVALLAIGLLESLTLPQADFELPDWSWMMAASALAWLAALGPLRQMFRVHPNWMSPVLLFAGLSLAGGLSWRLESRCLPFFDEPTYLVDVVPVKSAGVFTDQGTPIEVFAHANPESLTEAMLRVRAKGEIAAPFQAIEVAPPDLRCNCHGWVFAQGAYVVRGDSLSCILKENGYEPVQEPTEGDVIIYHDPRDGRILHSGKVRATGAQGFVLIESKWGPMHRFVHAPESQPYSADFVYYRSSRVGHALAGVSKGKVPIPVMAEATFQAEPAEGNRAVPAE
jgi:hypothetical protein